MKSLQTFYFQTLQPVGQETELGPRHWRGTETGEPPDDFYFSLFRLILKYLGHQNADSRGGALPPLLGPQA